MNPENSQDDLFEAFAARNIMLRTNAGNEEKFDFEVHQYVVMNKISDEEFREKLVARYRDMFTHAIRTLFENHPKQNTQLPEDALAERVDIIVSVLRQVLEGTHVYNHHLDNEELIAKAELGEHIPKAFVMFTFEITAPNDAEIPNTLETSDDLYVYVETEQTYKLYKDTQTQAS